MKRWQKRLAFVDKKATAMHYKFNGGFEKTIQLDDTFVIQNPHMKTSYGDAVPCQIIAREFIYRFMMPKGPVITIKKLSKNRRKNYDIFQDFNKLGGLILYKQGKDGYWIRTFTDKAKSVQTCRARELLAITEDPKDNGKWSWIMFTFRGHVQHTFKLNKSDVERLKAVVNKVKADAGGWLYTLEDQLCFKTPSSW